MMARCYRKTDTSYKNYGARNIRVCSHWIEDIYNFRVWFERELVARGISQEDFISNSRHYQLDRIDSNGHYLPENCRIVNPQQNIRNRRVCSGKVIESAEGEKFEF